MEIIQSDYLDDVFVNTEEKKVPFHMTSLSYHNAHEIYILLSGERRIYIGDRAYSTVSGDAALIRPDESHRSEGVTPYSGICIQFTDHYLDRYFTAEAKQRMLRCFENHIISLDQEMLSKIEAYLKQLQTDPDNKFMYLPAVLAALDSCRIKVCDGAKEYKEQDFKSIIYFINKNYAGISGLGGLAERMGVTREYFCRLFKRQTGMTAVTYLNNIRIQEACRLLTVTDGTVESISVQCGFKSVVYFNRLFKKMMNYTPGQYRRLTAKSLKS